MPNWDSNVYSTLNEEHLLSHLLSNRQTRLDAAQDERELYRTLGRKPNDRPEKDEVCPDHGELFNVDVHDFGILPVTSNSTPFTISGVLER